MSLFERTLRLPQSRDEVVAWHLRPGAFRRLSPPWLPIELVRDAPVEDGSRLSFRLKFGPVGILWVAEHRDVGRHGFRDVQVQGPFALWNHLHLILDGPDDSALLRDRIEFRLPLGPLAPLAAPLVRADLRRMFAWRHRRTADDLALQAALGHVDRRSIHVEGSGRIASTVRDLARGSVHRLTDDSTEADIAIREDDAPGVWSVATEAGTVRLHLPLLLAADPANRSTVVRRLLAGSWRSPRPESPFPWLSLEDAAALLLGCGVAPPAPGHYSACAPDPLPRWALAAAPLAWVGTPRQLPVAVEPLPDGPTPRRHPDIASLLRDALGRTS